MKKEYNIPEGMYPFDPEMAKDSTKFQVVTRNGEIVEEWKIDEEKPFPLSIHVTLVDPETKKIDGNYIYAVGLDGKKQGIASESKFDVFLKKTDRYAEFTDTLENAIKNKPAEWRLGQTVFNTIDEYYGSVAREVQFNDHVDCFYNDANVGDFVECCWIRICSSKE